MQHDCFESSLGQLPTAEAVGFRLAAAMSECKRASSGRETDLKRLLGVGSILGATPTMANSVLSPRNSRWFPLLWSSCVTVGSVCSVPGSGEPRPATTVEGAVMAAARNARRRITPAPRSVWKILLKSVTNRVPNMRPVFSNSPKSNQTSRGSLRRIGFGYYCATKSYLLVGSCYGPSVVGTSRSHCVASTATNCR